MNTILVFRPDHIGDVVLTTAALRALRLGFPRARLSILIGSWSQPILSGNTDIDELIVCDLPGLTRGSRVHWGQVAATIRQLRQRDFSAIVNLRTAASTALFTYLCGGQTRWGFAAPKSRWAGTHTIPFEKTRHVVDASLDLVRAMGCPTPTPAALRLFPDESAQHRAAALLRELSPPFVVLNQGAGHPAKLWEPDRWARVADWVAAHGYAPVFSGSPAEQGAVEAIRHRMDHPSLNLAGRCDLLTFAAVLDRSRFVVTVDSASLHMAVAMQTPVVALFGPTDSRRWGPYANGCPNVVIEKQGTCRYCKRQKGCRARTCMKMIEVDEVIAGLQSLCRSEQQSSAPP